VEFTSIRVTSQYLIVSEKPEMRILRLVEHRANRRKTAAQSAFSAQVSVIKVAAPKYSNRLETFSNFG
jgi:hypothetical protein